MRELLRRLRFLLHRAEYESDLEEEMAHHLAMLETEKGLHAGARKQFGNVTTLQEESRSMWTFRWMEQLAQDLRYAARAMKGNLLFTATAALSLALGIGANTAIYSFMDAILLRSLPVEKPEQLALIEWHSAKRPPVVRGINGSNRRNPGGGSISPNIPYAAYATLRAGTQVFSTLFAYTYVQRFNVIAGQQAESLDGGFVSGNYFHGLGVPSAAGRLLSDFDDRKGAAPAAVLTYAYWQQRYNGDPGAIGKSMRVNGVPFTIAGVTAPGFFGVDPQSNPKFFLPIHALPSVSPFPVAEEKSRFFDDHLYWIETMGRLRPGVSLAQAEAATQTAFTAYARSTAQSPNDLDILPQIMVEPGGAGLGQLRRQYSEPLYVLMTMVGLILAIACANLANLLLARAAARRREIAVRLSLGAGRWRLVRQMLTESVLLSITGGALGLLVALGGIRLITWLLSNGATDFTLRAELDWPVLAFTFGLAVLAGLAFGLAPAIQATKTDFTPALKESRTQGAAGNPRRFRLRMGHALIVAQIAVSMLLVVAAGLFVRTLFNLHSIDVGFNRENILLVSINARPAGYSGPPLARFYSGLLDKFRQIPGVRAATASNFPLVAQYVNDDTVSIPGRPKTGQQRDSNFLNVDPDFFATMQIPILHGRSFEPGDLASPSTAVVNEEFVKQFFGSGDPLGREFVIGGEKPARTMQIVGVARAAHYNSLKEKPEPVAYVLYNSDLPNLRGLFFELRTAGDPQGVAAEVRRVLQRANREVPISAFTTQAERMDQTISQQRTFANLGTSFALLALAIACVGLYGAMSYTVARRTGEIGIRMALGAQRQRIVWMVLREVLALTAAGLLAGYIAARYTTSLVASFLYGLKPNDWMAVAAAGAILFASALLAGFAPAWRASRIDPAVALRNE